LPPLNFAGAREHPGPLKRYAVLQVLWLLLIGGFIKFKRGFVILPRLCLDPFLKEILGRFRGGQKCRKKKQNCEGCCNLPHTLLLIDAFPKSFIFQGK
jgi:hypothetical protein